MADVCRGIIAGASRPAGSTRTSAGCKHHRRAKTYAASGISSRRPGCRSADIVVQDETVGAIERLLHPGDAAMRTTGRSSRRSAGCINTIADRLGHFILHQQLRQVAAIGWKSAEPWRANGERSGRSILESARNAPIPRSVDAHLPQDGSTTCAGAASRRPSSCCSSSPGPADAGRPGGSRTDQPYQRQPLETSWSMTRRGLPDRGQTT